MRLFTCGSSLPIPTDIFSNFDGVIAGYYWDLWDTNPNRPSVFNFSEGKISRSHFLYGNKDRKPPTQSKCKTIEDWVRKRVSKFPEIDEWVIVNEFTGEFPYTYYPGYNPEEVISYCKIVHEINPEAKLIIADFKPWMIGRWLESIKLVVEMGLEAGLPIELGIQTHIKTINAPVILTQLPRILKTYKNLCPTHFIEASVWYSTELDKKVVNAIWCNLVDIAIAHNVVSFCPWWLNEVDEAKMPTFENFKGGSIFDKNWNLKVSEKVLLKK